MQAGWSSLTLEKYAMYRYGEDIPASTFRSYRGRAGIERLRAPWVKEAESVLDADAAVDVVTQRADLIALQRERIAIDVRHERDMSKLFGSTKAEIATLNALLDAHKADLQDLGLFPKAGEKLTIETPATPGAGVPRVQRLGDLLGGVTDEEEMAAAKVLHLGLKTAANGHGE